MIKCSPYSQLTFADICYNDPLKGTDKTVGSGVLTQWQRQPNRPVVATTTETGFDQQSIGP
jgi:hypothetical protein